MFSIPAKKSSRRRRAGSARRRRLKRPAGKTKADNAGLPNPAYFFFDLAFFFLAAFLALAMWFSSFGFYGNQLNRAAGDIC